MPIELDVRTLTLSYITVAITFGVGLMIYGWRHREFRGVRTVAIAFLAIGAGFEFIGLRGEIPLFVSIPVANCLIFGGRCAVIIGVATLVDAPGRRQFMQTALVFTGILFALLSYFTFVDFNVNNRIITFSALYSTIAALGALMLMRGRKPYGRGMARTIAVLFLCIAAFHVFRLVRTLDAAELSTFMDAGLVHAVSISLSQLLIMFAAIGVIWIVADGLQHELRQLALTDPLTRCLNRRAFDERRDAEWARARRRGRNLGVIAVDIDHFKAVNDTHGHEAGDAVLRAVADRMRESVRADDVVARFAGEEFVILLADTGLAEAKAVAEKLRLAIAATPVETPAMQKAIPVTASFGVAVSPGGRRAAADTLRAADEALYAAKESGRNRVIAMPADDRAAAQDRPTPRTAS